MRLQDIDFPSDPNCFLPKGFRQVMTAALHRAADNLEAEKVLKEQFAFCIKKLKAIPAEREQIAKAVAKRDAKAYARLNPVVEEPQDEGSGD